MRFFSARGSKISRVAAIAMLAVAAVGAIVLANRKREEPAA